MEQTLRYRTPAKKFSEALPIGNGSLGAMVYGDFPDFHYSLNAETLWSGRPGEKKPVVVDKEERRKVKELLKEGRFAEAEQVVLDCMVGKQYNESYLGAGFLHLEFSEDLEQRGITRELSLDTACARTEIDTEDGRICIESFASGQDEALVTHVTAQKPVSVVISAGSLLHTTCRTVEGELELQGEAPSHVEPNYVDSGDPVRYGGGMKYSILTRAVCDGRVEALDGKLRIIGTAFTLYTVICTGFRGYDQPMEEDYEVLKAEGLGKLKAAIRYSYPELRERHVKAHKRLFGRVSLSLNDSDEASRQYELLFQYGRYLMICSSRPGTPYGQPANLQGIWCEDIRSVWSSNFTVNINTEMNYWLTGPCALSECDEPLLNMIWDIAGAGQETAEKTCGCRGWAACHNVDLWRQTTPVEGEAKWAWWPMGGVWLTTHLYQHYLYTNDRVFLKEQAYPVMRGAARFCMDWLYQEDGVWYTSPNTSPENTFFDEQGRVCCVSRNVTMDHALMREVLEGTLDAGKLLGEEPGFLQQIEKAISHLPEYRVGAHGQLMEWEHDFAEVDVNHRHFAHLVGFHPFHQIDFENRRELLSAVKRVLEQRTEGMELEIGWNEGWLTNFCARLRDGEGAKKHLDLFLKHCVYPNLLGLHPPLGESPGEREIFQIDGNFGIAAGIGEMLMQGKPGYVSLLPALPHDWKKGQVKGLMAPGGHKVDISWDGGVITQAVITGGSDGEVMVVYGQPFYAEDGQGNRIAAALHKNVGKESAAYEEGVDYRLILPVKKDAVYTLKSR